MKHSRLFFAALAAAAIASWAVYAIACDSKAKSAATSSDHAACTAAMAAKCTPEMAAACKAKGASAVTASAAGSGCPAHAKLSAVTAVQSGETATYRSAGAGSSCGSKATRTSSTAAARVDAVPVGGGASCSGHGAVKTADRSSHAGCDACADMASCDGEVRNLGATVQVVPLKNGVMYVYTAESPSKVQAVQASMARRDDHLASLKTAGDKARLCAECKAMRGAVASGKLNRELVNIEGGCLTLMTSSDPGMVAKIYAIAGLQKPVSVKS